ncbi:tag-124, partial [Pristionchus pacificus]
QTTGMKRKHEPANGEGGETKKLKALRPFDFAAHPKRKIALRFFYYGWLFDGLVQQRDTENTVEKHLLDALLKTRLIESAEECDMTRCGRTDKGVSAFKQVAALVVRSATVDEQSFWAPETSEETKLKYKQADDLPYLKMLNGVLPPSIRVTAWAPVPLSFSARHACSSRIYKYALPRASYDLEKLRAAAKLLEGRHDFRNFCQIDMNVARVEMSYVREIVDVRVEEVRPSPSPSRYDLLELTVVGTGFLWHQIRFIVGVLHEIGQGKEEVELITRLLDVAATPRRPVYSMAVDSPLCLFDCRFEREGQAVQWRRAEGKVFEKNLTHLQREWAEAATRARLLENMMGALVDEAREGGEAVDEDRGLLEFVQDKPQSGAYVPFAARKTCDSLEEKADKLREKRARE